MGQLGDDDDEGNSFARKVGLRGLGLLLLGDCLANLSLRVGVEAEEDGAVLKKEEAESVRVLSSAPRGRLVNQSARIKLDRRTRSALFF